MTLHVVCRPAWLKEYNRNVQDYPMLLRQPVYGPTESPDSIDDGPAFRLGVGLKILYERGERQYSTGFIEIAYQSAQQTIDARVADRCDLLEGASPWAGLYRARGHAGWLLGKSWDAVSRDLRLAAEYLEKANTSTKTDRVDWDSISQGQWLGAVRLLMLVRDFDAARTLLKKKRRFGHAPDEYRLLTALLADPAGAHANVALQDDFDRFYDPLRLPYPPKPPPPQEFFDIKYLRWELGLLRDQLFISPTGVPDLDRVITMIGT